MDNQVETVAEVPQNEASFVQQPIDLNSLSLEKVSIHYTYLLEKASIGQIMKRLSNLAIKDPKNPYQRALNEYFETAVPKLISAYNTLLKCSTYEEYVVKDYNLLGNLPKNMSLDTSIKKSPNLYQASVGDMLTALKQRIEFIAKRDIPMFYEKNNVYVEPFKRMQKQVLDLLPAITEFEDGFKDKTIKQKPVKTE